MKISIRYCVEHFKRNVIAYTVFFISAYAFYLRIAKLARHKLWADEIAQVGFAQVSFIEMVKNMPHKEFCSYISLNTVLTYPFIRLFPNNKWGMTIPEVIITILGFYLLYLICRLNFKTIWGYVITFTIVCFNVTLIDHATEIRQYAVLPTLALGVFYFSQVFVEQIDMKLRKKWLSGIFLVLVIWFHPYGIIMVFSCFAYSLAANLHNPAFGVSFRKNLAFLAVVFLIAMPLWLISVLGPHYPFPTESETFFFIPNPIINLTGFLKAVFGNLIGYKKLYFLLIGVAFPFLITYRERFRQIGFLFVVVFIPLQLIFLSDLWHNYLFLQRQFIWVIPLFAFFIGWVWDSLFVLLKRNSAKGGVR